MIKLSYSTNGLLNLDLFSAIEAVEKAGYAGVELSFDKRQFNPFELTQEDLAGIRTFFDDRTIKPACIATPTISFLNDRPHEPSMICLDRAGRKQRIQVVKKGVEIAKSLGAPIVSFGSGFIRDEHVSHPEINPKEILAESVRECLKDIGDITLVIEPEPGMLLETLDQGVEIVKAVGSPQFQLHADLCHVYCSDTDYFEAIAKAAPYTRYLHVSDTTDGCNVKLLSYKEDMKLNFDFASYLIYFPETCNFLFLDKKQALCFYEDAPDTTFVRMIEPLKGKKTVRYISYNGLSQASSPLDREINTYAVSVPGLSFYVLDRAKPILRYLRTPQDGGSRPILDKKVANTLTGKVHYHDIPGQGKIDFTRTFQTLEKNGFSGYATVELYHHVDTWKKALEDSIEVLSEADEYEGEETWQTKKVIFCR